MEHELKTLGLYFDAVERGEKTFEVRKHDRLFTAGDTLVLRRIFHDTKDYCEWAKPLRCLVTYVLPGGEFGIAPDYCVMGIKVQEDKQ